MNAPTITVSKSSVSPGESVTIKAKPNVSGSGVKTYLSVSCGSKSASTSSTTTASITFSVSTNPGDYDDYNRNISISAYTSNGSEDSSTVTSSISVTYRPTASVSITLGGVSSGAVSLRDMNTPAVIKYSKASSGYINYIGTAVKPYSGEGASSETRASNSGGSVYVYPPGGGWYSKSYTVVARLSFDGHEFNAYSTTFYPSQWVPPSVYTRLLYPISSSNNITLNSRKVIIFTADSSGYGNLSDVNVSYSSSTNKSYKYSTHPDYFSFYRLSRDESTGNVISATKYNKGESIPLNGDYFIGLFKIPELISTQTISNFTISVTSTDSDQKTTSTSFNQLSYATCNEVKSGDYVLSSQRSALSNILDSIKSSYSQLVTYLKLNNTTSSLDDAEIVRWFESSGDDTYKNSFESWTRYLINLYTKLSTLFPQDFTVNSVINNMYLPSEGSNIILQGISESFPQSSPNGNFYNNIIWILKNLL